MDYKELRIQTNRGWNTWNTSNILSHVCLPWGFSINLCFKDYSCERLLRETLVGRFGQNEEHVFPGIRSWNGSYTSLNVKYAESEFNAESTVDGDDQIILITPVKYGRRIPTIIAEACILWGRAGSVSQTGQRIFGDFKDGKHFEIFTSGKPYQLPYSYSLSPNFAVDLSEPVVISTRQCCSSEARKLLDTAKAQVISEANKFGDNAETYCAIKSCLAWNTIYECEKDRICSPVSRRWNQSWGGFVLFEWDTFFAGLLASIDNPELAWLNTLAIANEYTENGFIPNFASNGNLKSRDRSQPPVGSMTALAIYRKWGGKWFLDELYDIFKKQNAWFSAHRMTEEGYLCWGSDVYEPVAGRYWECNEVGVRAGAALESGLDNSPMYDDMTFDPATGRSNLADVGLTGLFIKDCKCLCEMAQILCHNEDIPILTERKAKAEAALSSLWNEKAGIFCNMDILTSTFSLRISPTNFYALFSDLVTEEQKTSMMQNYFYNPKEFWGEFIMPSISRSDPAYKDQNYWRGRIWAPLNYLVYEALKDSGLCFDANKLAEKSRELLLKEWRAHGHVHENYSGDDGWGCGSSSSDKFYHWGGLLGYIALDASEINKV